MTAYLNLKGSIRMAGKRYQDDAMMEKRIALGMAHKALGVAGNHIEKIRDEMRLRRWRAGLVLQGQPCHTLPRVNDDVITPYGIGVVQGRTKDEQGNLGVLVAFTQARTKEHFLVVDGFWKLMAFGLDEVWFV